MNAEKIEYQARKKTVYQADMRGFFLHPDEASELFFQPGEFNMPFGSVEQEPPPAGEGFVPRLIGGKWEVVEDHRGEVLYVASTGAHYEFGTLVELDGSSVIYDGGGPVPAWLTNVPPEPEPAVEQVVTSVDSRPISVFQTDTLKPMYHALPAAGHEAG